MIMKSLCRSPSSPAVSPISCDSWLLYPGTGRSPTSSTLGECSSSEDASSSSLSTFNLLTSQTNKRSRPYRLNEAETDCDIDDDVSNDADRGDDKKIFQTCHNSNMVLKRQKYSETLMNTLPKEPCSNSTVSSNAISLPTNVPSSKRRHVTATSRNNVSRVLSNNTDPQVDVRMIDFAHTTFSSRRGSATSNTTVHHGPDCGFLTGLDSLKRLLLEIITDE